MIIYRCRDSNDKNHDGFPAGRASLEAAVKFTSTHPRFWPGGDRGSPSTLLIYNLKKIKSLSFLSKMKKYICLI